MPTLSEVKPDAPGANEAIERVNEMYREGFQRVRETYRLNEAAVDRLGSYWEDYSVVACFADWCGDARRAIPVLALIEEKTGKKIPTLGGMTKPPPGSSEFWAVPPSPAEVKTFEVTSSPTILVFSREGHEIGRIKTRPRMMPTMEEEILKIIEDHESQAD